MKLYGTSIFIFRRDFRTYDNTGLIAALKNSKIVIPIFIFTPEQLKNNKYKSDNSVQFMIESLKDLEIKVFYFYGKPYKIIEKLIKNVKIDAVFVNMDYTPYSIKRDKLIEGICKNNSVAFNSFSDITLLPINSIKNITGETYTKFTPFYTKAKKIKIDLPSKNIYHNYFRGSIPFTFKRNIDSFFKENNNLWRNGGRSNGIRELKKLKLQKKYETTRNDLSKETSNLSAFLKYGCISIREAYWTIKRVLGPKNSMIRQLYWRDFYYNIMYSFPYVVKSNLKKQYDRLKWNNNSAWLRKWERGETGFPIVDAGMRQLNTTGYMHNRSRLITASFLIKLLHIDWRKGEKYFSNKLYDIDLSQNNGNFGWVSSTGADSQPYFRIFNPWMQSEKHDAKCLYIKKWVPELAEVENKDIHRWNETYMNYKNIKYPKPMIDYTIEKKRSISMYKKVFYRG